MARRIFRHGVIILLLIVAGCVKKAPTSPPFEYAGEWTGRWTDYVFYNTSAGKPLGSSLLLIVNEDGSAAASGSLEEKIGGVTYTDRIRMTLLVLPDGSVTGTGEWGVNFAGYTLGGEGEVIGQLEAENETGSGVLLVVFDDTTRHFPWHVTRSK
ncbi:hypothetical protein KA005_35635 [bacterium]|nr:hypothetical protein [bacterium]